MGILAIMRAKSLSCLLLAKRNVRQLETARRKCNTGVAITKLLHHQDLIVITDLEFYVITAKPHSEYGMRFLLVNGKSFLIFWLLLYDRRGYGSLAHLF